MKFSAALGLHLVLLVPAVTGAQGLGDTEGPSVRAGRGHGLVVVDAAAHRVGGGQAGAVYLLDLLEGPDQVPRLVAAADQGAPFRKLSGVHVSSVDGHAYLTDELPLGEGRVWRLDLASGRVEVASEDVRLRRPMDITELPSGELAIVDADAWGLPSPCDGDATGPLPSGAVFGLDPLTEELRVLSDGASHDLWFNRCRPSAFDDPQSIAFDPRSRRLIVVEAPRLAFGFPSTDVVYSVDPSSGFVTLLTAVQNDAANPTVVHHPLRVAAGSDGRLVVTAGSDGFGRDEVWEILPEAPDPWDNMVLVSEFADLDSWSGLRDLIIDARDRILVSEALGVGGRGRGIFRIDESAPFTWDNREPVSDWDGWVEPAALALDLRVRTPGDGSLPRLGPVRQGAGSSVRDCLLSRRPVGP